MNFSKSAFVFTFLCAAPLVVCEDWSSLFRGLTSRDQIVREAAGRKLMTEILPRVAQEDASALTKDLEGITDEFTDGSDNVRVQSSGLIVGLSTRHDGAVVLRQTIPV